MSDKPETPEEMTARLNREVGEMCEVMTRMFEGKPVNVALAAIGGTIAARAQNFQQLCIMTTILQDMAGQSLAAKLQFEAGLGLPEGAAVHETSTTTN